MDLQRSLITETPVRRTVEMFFADRPDPAENEAQIRFVVIVAAKEQPLLAEVQLEGLRIVQTEIGNEIERLTRIRGQDE